jgi:transketolase
VHEALLAAKRLNSSKIGSVVVNMHTVKPIDERTLIKYAKLTGCVVTVEEHQVNGGMGSAVSEVLSANFPLPIEFIGMQDSFGESGSPAQLLRKYKMKAVNITRAAKQVIKRKNN